jgi:UDP-2,3-diacylglucosamine pyrophosphatase LpxH
MAKRAFILGDVHIGIRANSMEWFEITKSYFEDFFIPMLRENYRPGDILIQLGDVFDNRQSINLKFINYAAELLHRIGQIVETHIIVGNHDLYFKNTNDVSSLDAFSFIPNIHLYKTPTVIDFGKAKCLMLPWCSTPEIEQEQLTKFLNKADYVFSHSEMRGLMLNKKVKQEHGTPLDSFSNYKRVYSGHIHYSQRNKNIVMAGNAYQMTRSDSDNHKGVYILDFETGEERFIENTHSPKFVKLHLNKMLEMPISHIKNLMQNNFVDIYIPSEVPIKYNLSGFMAMVQTVARKIEPNIYDEKTYIDVENINEEIQNGYKNFNVVNLCTKYIEGMNIDEDIKDRMNSEVQRLYIECSNNYNPNEN